MSQTAQPPCPICKKPADEKFRPFCSKRCADIDLGAWFSGRYAIPGEAAEPEDLASARPRSDEDEG